MRLRNPFKHSKAEILEQELATAEVVIQPKRKGRVHTHVKRPSWSLDRPDGGGVRRAMPKGLRKMKEQANE